MSTFLTTKFDIFSKGTQCQRFAVRISFIVYLLSTNLSSVHGSTILSSFVDENATKPVADLNETSPSNGSFEKVIFGALRWRYSLKGSYMAHCNSEEECDAGFRMICNGGRCVCKTGDIFFEWPKYGCFSKAPMFGPCEVSGQCIAMNLNTYCNPDNGRCTCSANYFYNGRECSIRYDGTNIKAQEVYKAAVVAAACFIVAVVGIFVACIVRRSFCRREQHLQQSESNRNSDIFSISDEIAALRAVDKPPSYEEVLQIERTFYGIPPPEYTAARSSSTLPALHSPTNCASAHVTCLNLPYSSEFLPATQSSSSGSPVTSEISKESDQEPMTACSEAYPTIPENVAATNFLAAAEVLPPPLNIEERHQTSTTSASLSDEPSHSRLPHYIASTLPRRFHRQHAEPAHSSSLPGSPHLASLSLQLNLVSNIPVSSNEELLKQYCQSSSPKSLSHPCRDSQSSSQADMSSISSLPDNRVLSNASDSNVENSHIALAYDNLGFVSDAHM